nr:MAG TPA: hypothetical protein [Caudoviricetes sp.]
MHNKSKLFLCILTNAQLAGFNCYTHSIQRKRTAQNRG